MAQRKGYNREEDTSDRLDKLRKKLQEESDELDRLGAKQLKEKIVMCQTGLVENQRAMESDHDYIAARNKLAKESAPFREAKSHLSQVAQYCALRLDESGASE